MHLLLAKYRILSSLTSNRIDGTMDKQIESRECTTLCTGEIKLRSRTRGFCFSSAIAVPSMWEEQSSTWMVQDRMAVCHTIAMRIIDPEHSNVAVTGVLSIKVLFYHAFDVFAWSSCLLDG